MQQRYRETLPQELSTKFLDDNRLIAHPPFLAGGRPVSDVAVFVRVPITSSVGDCLGYVSFSLPAERWGHIFPANVCLRTSSSSGHVIKTAAAFDRNVHAHEPVLDLDVECRYNVGGGTLLLYIMGTAFSVLILGMTLALLWRFEVTSSRERLVLASHRRFALQAEQQRDALRKEAAAEQRVKDAFVVSEKTERYLNHELKNRIIVLGQSCAEQALHGQIEEIAEVLTSKTALMRLSSRRYLAALDAVEPAALVDLRRQRFSAANSPFFRSETTGAAAFRKELRLDKVLFNIILDNMLSNAFKYGDASKPPLLSMHLEPVDEKATRVRLFLELRNWAGSEHSALLRMGEEALNEIAQSEGARAHIHAADLSSGDGFFIMAAAAHSLGGTVRLVLLQDGVIAKLELPNVSAVVREEAKPAKPVDLSRMKIAMADDSATFRKTFRKIATTVTTQEPYVAGETRESIDSFPKAVVDGDVDVLLLDFNFAPVHHTKTGVDLCRECRALDLEEGNVPRVIFVVSANDSPEDSERYIAAGADGCLGKKLTVAKLRKVLEDAVRTHPRFAAHRAGNWVSEFVA